MVVLGEWLNDRHLQTICESRFCHNEVDEPRAYPFVVEQIQAVLQEFAEPKSQSQRSVLRRHFCIVNSEASEGLHWFVVAWDGRLPPGETAGLSPLERASWAVQNFAVRIVDSMDTDFYSAPLVQALRNLGIEPKLDILGTQGDSWRCGYFACWSLERMLRTKSRGFMTVRIPPMPVEYTAKLFEILEDCPSTPTVPTDDLASEPSSPTSASPPQKSTTPQFPEAPKPFPADFFGFGHPVPHFTRASKRMPLDHSDFPGMDPLLATFFAPRRNAWAECSPQRTVSSIPVSVIDPWAAATVRATPMIRTAPLFLDSPLSKRARGSSAWPFAQTDPFASFWF